MKKLLILSVGLFMILSISGCHQNTTAAEEISTTEYKNSGEFTFYPSESSESSTSDITEPKNLNSPPNIKLSDSLSSQINSFTAKASNYEWTYIEKGEEIGITACGLSPTDINIEDIEKLKLNNYNKIDYTPITLTADAAPDFITISEWDITAAETKADADSTETLYDTFFINLKPNKIYEITAEWERSKIKERGFSGNASYIIVTEPQN